MYLEITIAGRGLGTTICTEDFSSDSMIAVLISGSIHALWFRDWFTVQKSRMQSAVENANGSNQNTVVERRKQQYRIGQTEEAHRRW
jgi:hypothetical protein